MKYSEYKDKMQRKKLQRQKRKGNHYVGTLVTAENRNALIEEFGTSYYDMYKQEMDKEKEKFIEDGSPEDYEWRFPEISEEQLTADSIAYGKQVLVRKKRELSAYLKGRTHYKWEGRMHPVMTQDYLLKNEQMKAVQQERHEKQLAEQMEANKESEEIPEETQSV